MKIYFRKLARKLRLSAVVNIYKQGLISEEDAKGLLHGLLTPGDATTFYDDSDLLDDLQALEKIDAEII